MYSEKKGACIYEDQRVVAPTNNCNTKRTGYPERAVDERVSCNVGAHGRDYQPTIARNHPIHRQKALPCVMGG